MNPDNLLTQETISDNSLFPEICENETSKNLTLDELHTSTGFSGNLEIMDTKCYLESSESDCYSCDSMASIVLLS